MSHTKPSTIDDLLEAIREALASHPAADGLHVSIEPHAREWNEGGGVTYVKALCWNLLEGETEPPDDSTELLVVDEDVDEEAIRAGVAARFPGLRCRVDNDILIEEDD